ncbi:hypothetical protein [Reichenbachiella sp. MALMAid0571]|uniref:NfeD family protein n=1 Tax=Reichenbachiella sp. MALMAid0571 TaxID=3143939 RepID=UPI0032DFFC60
MSVEIYWNIAIYSSGFLGVFVLLNLLGMDIDSIDIDFLGDHFSFSSIIAFICVGSWTGFLAHNMTSMSDLQVLISSIMMGLVALVGSIFFLKKLKGWEEKGNIDINNAIGKTGKVYLGIPAKGEGSGQVQVIIQGRLKTFHAKTNQEKIETGTEIIIYDVKENVLYVEPYKHN